MHAISPTVTASGAGATDELPGRWGLAAVAEAGNLSLEVDEGLDAEAHAITVSAPPVRFRFVFRNGTSPADMLRFLTAEWHGFAEFPNVGGPPSEFKLVRDDEFADRVFLRLSGNGSRAELTLTADLLRDFIAALTDAVDQLL